MTAMKPPQTSARTNCGCERATFADALIGAGRALADSWSSPLTEAEKLEWKEQFPYALAGAYLWLFVNLTPAVLGDTFEIFDGGGDDTARFLPVGWWLSLATVLLNLLAGLFFAWLITFRGRRQCSPGRLFVDGLLLPGITAALVKGAFLVRLLTAVTGGQPQ